MAESARRVLPLPPNSDDKMLWELSESVYLYPCLTVADEVGVFAFLSGMPATADGVARGLGLSLRGVQVLLSVLAAQGLLLLREGRFMLAEIARIYLLPDSPLYRGARMHPDWANLRHVQLLAAVRAGGPQDDPWEQHRLSPEQATLFTRSMDTFLPMALAVAVKGTFAEVKRLLDVAGGSGCYSIALAQYNPTLHCTVLELPSVCPATSKYVAEYGMQARVGTHAADMFNGFWPPNHDAVFFSNIFHNWPGERCQHLAQRCFAYLPAGGRIYLHEMLMNDQQDGPLATALFSAHMLVLAGGKQYSALELQGILTSVGFTNVSVTPTFGYYSLLSAQKPQS